MRIQVSKTFASFINKTARELGFKCFAEVVKCPARYYEFRTGDSLLDAMDWGDYDWENIDAKVLMITYPAEYYACEKFVTTRQLNKEYKDRGVESLQDLKGMIRDLFEI